jgi:lipid-A-disaccharide synthase
VNIVAGKKVVKEFIQHDAEPTALAKEIVSLIEDKDYRAQVISGLKTVQHKLGNEEGSTLVAQLAFEMLGSIHSNEIIPSH